MGSNPIWRTMKKINIDKWNKLIDEHFLSAKKNNSNYKYTIEEMRSWWFDKLSRNPENDVEDFILGSTHANNNGYRFHPV